MCEGNENLMNVPYSTMSEFFKDLKGRLAAITGLTIPESKLTPKKIKIYRRPLCVISLPGVGKTIGIESVIEELNKRLPEEKQIGFKKIQLGATVVGSLNGIPVPMHDGTVKRVELPDLPVEERDGKYGVLFLDELTTADEAQAQPAYLLADDSRCIGTYTLPEHWMVVAAGNGPDCRNFVRFDEALVNRFVIYNISYDFVTDWRPWAIENGINENIIAYLNMYKEDIVLNETDEMDPSGNQAPSPRTWERLNDELQLREDTGDPVGKHEMGRFVGRIVGARVARKFMSFYDATEGKVFDPEKIACGEEDTPIEEIQKEVFFSTLQRCTTYLKEGIESEDNGTDNLSDFCYEAVANTLAWFLRYQNYDLDCAVTAFLQLKNDSPVIRKIMASEKFDELCPEFTEFADQYGDTIISHSDTLNMGF